MLLGGGNSEEEATGKEKVEKRKEEKVKKKGTNILFLYKNLLYGRHHLITTLKQILLALF